MEVGVRASTHKAQSSWRLHPQTINKWVSEENTIEIAEQRNEKICECDISYQKIQAVKNQWAYFSRHDTGDRPDYHISLDLNSVRVAG